MNGFYCTVVDACYYSWCCPALGFAFSLLVLLVVFVLKLALHKLGVEGLDDVRADTLDIGESPGHCIDSRCLFRGLDANVGLWL